MLLGKLKIRIVEVVVTAPYRDGRHLSDRRLENDRLSQANSDVRAFIAWTKLMSIQPQGAAVQVWAAPRARVGKLVKCPDSRGDFVAFGRRNRLPDQEQVEY
jgi:hypothetical protein